MLSGSMSVIASCKTLVKLTPVDEYFASQGLQRMEKLSRGNVK